VATANNYYGAEPGDLISWMRVRQETLALALCWLEHYEGYVLVVLDENLVRHHILAKTVAIIRKRNQ
jgi:hypothetical protein